MLIIQCGCAQCIAHTTRRLRKKNIVDTPLVKSHKEILRLRKTVGRLSYERKWYKDRWESHQARLKEAQATAASTAAENERLKLEVISKLRFIVCSVCRNMEALGGHK